LLGTGQELQESVGFRLVPEDQELFDEHIAAIRTQLGEPSFAVAWAEGQAMPVDQAIALAQSVAPPGLSDAGDRLPPARPATGADFGRLTKREREVAALVSQGESNREIAAELIVSERTVEGHVNNILTKLGFRSRAQVAAWAVEKGLTQAPPEGRPSGSPSR
jgi:non-specific serine/threonine protein kinase